MISDKVFLLPIDHFFYEQNMNEINLNIDKLFIPFLSNEDNKKKEFYEDKQKIFFENENSNDCTNSDLTEDFNFSFLNNNTDDESDNSQVFAYSKDRRGNLRIFNFINFFNYSDLDKKINLHKLQIIERYKQVIYNYSYANNISNQENYAREIPMNNPSNSYSTGNSTINSDDVFFSNEEKKESTKLVYNTYIPIKHSKPLSLSDLFVKKPHEQENDFKIKLDPLNKKPMITNKNLHSETSIFNVIKKENLIYNKKINFAIKNSLNKNIINNINIDNTGEEKKTNKNPKFKISDKIKTNLLSQNSNKIQSNNSYLGKNKNILEYYMKNFNDFFLLENFSNLKNYEPEEVKVNNDSKYLKINDFFLRKNKKNEEPKNFNSDSIRNECFLSEFTNNFIIKNINSVIKDDYSNKSMKLVFTN